MSRCSKSIVGIKYILATVLLAGYGALAPTAHAQWDALAVRLKTSLNQGHMPDMKDLQAAQATLWQRDGIPVRAVESFPARYGLEVEVASQSPQQMFSFGVTGRYRSTGGRLHYADYSGVAVYDQVFTQWSFGTFVEYPFWRPRPALTAWVGLHNHYNFTSGRSTGLVRVHEVAEVVLEEEISARSYSVEPVVVFQATRRRLQGRLSLGYEYDLGAELQTEDGRTLRISSSSDPARIQWHGLRLGVAVGLRLGSMEKVAQ